MFYDPEGPIERFEWGYFQINGEIHSEDGDGVGKDICIVRGIVLPWEERVGHKVKPEMVAPILKEGLTILVIGNGVKGRLKVIKKTRQVISAAGIETILIEKTPVACAIYNCLFHEGKSVGLLAHGTC